MKNNKQKEYNKKQRDKRVKFLIKVCIPYCILSIFIFLFGYDTPMFDDKKLSEFFPAFFFILIIIILIALLKYKIVPVCNNCGTAIKNVKKDCVIGKVELIKTIEKTEYQTMNTTIKGKTVYPRGGYSMKNSLLEPTSESTYEVNQQIPIQKKYYVYNIEYRCKKCNEVYCNHKEESKDLLHFNKEG